VRLRRDPTEEPHVYVCRACFQDGIDDGIIDPTTGDFFA
jgi:hypothetical protein